MENAIPKTHPIYIYIDVVYIHCTFVNNIVLYLEQKNERSLGEHPSVLHNTNFYLVLSFFNHYGEKAKEIFKNKKNHTSDDVFFLIMIPFYF